jgi:LysM repeat protein
MKSQTARLVLIVLLLMGVLLVPASSALAAPAQASAQTYHVVQYGENLTMIATHYGVTVSAIMQANGLANPNVIYVGQRLVIPGSASAPPPPPSPVATGCTHVVHANENLTMIAVRYNTSVYWLMSANAIPNANFIYVGQRLVVPCAPPPPPPPKPAPKPAPSVPSVSFSIEAARELIAELMPQPQPIQPTMCNPAVSIDTPIRDQHVCGALQIIGTADIPDFQFYKVEYGIGEQPLEFISINEVHRQAVSNSLLEVWNTDAYPEGVYILRLTAVDNRGQYPPPCDVRIFIDRN